MITVDEVRAAVEKIRVISDDDETAHTREDALHFKVLMAIADGAPDSRELAEEAVKTAAIDFARWCA